MKNDIFVKADRIMARSGKSDTIEIRLLTDYIDQRKKNTIAFKELDLDEAKEIRDFLTKQIELIEEGKNRGWI